MFLSQLERGKTSASIGMVFNIVGTLGLDVTISARDGGEV